MNIFFLKILNVKCLELKNTFWAIKRPFKITFDTHSYNFDVNFKFLASETDKNILGNKIMF